MKDPKVIELVKQFNKDVKALNKTWAQLQTYDVYIKLDIKGANSYKDPKCIEINTITQSVQYKDETNVG